MVRSLVILGWQPAIGMAELESLFGADKLQPVGGNAAILNIAPDAVPFKRLGGSVKICKLLTELPFTDWQKITDYLVGHVPKHTCCIGPGKLTLGISTYGFSLQPRNISATGLSVKKAVRATDRSVRIVPGKTTALSSAQILHNRLFTELSWELILVKDGSRTLLAQTTTVQDINAYAARDQKRPKRDMRVGMLPPKLAQLIVNLAVGEIEEKGVRSEEKGEALPAPHSTLRTPAEGLTVLDPFCGTGVVLQEALLMGYDVIGTDLEPRMIEFSKANLDWLRTGYRLQVTDYSFELHAADATTHTWPPFDTIATETYLGQPFSAPPAAEKLKSVIKTCDLIHSNFLKNIRTQTRPGFRMCIAVPAWRTRTTNYESRVPKFHHLPVLDKLNELGYNRINFVHAKGADLIYHRPAQIVARELVVLTRI